MVSKVKRAHPGRGLNNFSFFTVVAACHSANGCSQSFWNLASTPRACCTKHLLRVCLRPFRNGDCEGFPSRPRNSSRAFRRRFKSSARRAWQGSAKGDSAPQGAKAGDAPPVGGVRIFRSADGQPAARKQAKRIVDDPSEPGHRAVVQSNGRGRDLWRRVIEYHRRIGLGRQSPRVLACRDRTADPEVLTEYPQVAVALEMLNG
jgi:hypothetical protein